jgi:hypothetical protein
MLRSALEPAHDEPALEVGRAALPRTFGPYELIEELGRGGMGVVYAAWQPVLGRTVAVKLLLSGPYSSEAAQRRFRLEAAAAAGLQHPNIVAIHDYGEVDGQPYYAMDLVAGRNLAELCAGRPLPARQAAEFLRLLADAVHYAHKCGVLHRDLKPSNVLVDKENRPRITDFGLAKLLGSTEGATLAGQILGSPNYSAPEQAMGRHAEITAATDVYGLGALFYHLVTGRAPFNAATPTETLRLVLDTEAPPPRLLNPALPRDLETICLKCLAKEPAQRYETPAEVAGDVDRFLNERPIHARPPGALYRMGKFARRHRTVVAAVAAVFLALVMGLGLALVGFHRAVVQRRAADAARNQAERLVGLMTHDLVPELEQRGGLQKLLRTTEAAVQYYESLPPEIRNTKTDQGHADALAALGRLQGRSLNDPKGAEVALRAALALREKIARDNPNDPEAVAGCLLDESRLSGVIGRKAARISEARWEEIIRHGRELHSRFPDNLRVKQCLAELLAGYAGVAWDQFAKQSEAVAAAAESHKLVVEILAAKPEDNAPPESTGSSLLASAMALRYTSRSAGKEALERTLAYCADALKADPGNLKLREQAAIAAQALSYGVKMTEPLLDAERIAREHYRVLIGLNPDDQVYRYQYAMTHMMECWYLINYGPDFESAQKAFDRFHALLDPFIARGGYYGDEAQWTWIYNRMFLAAFAAWAGEPAEAREDIERAQLHFADYFNRSPEGSFERCYKRVIFLSSKEYAFYNLRDWQAMAGAARDCQAEIEAGLRIKPANGPLLLRQAEANAYLAVTAQHEGRSPEAIALLRPAIGIMIAAPTAYMAAELPSVPRIAQKALTESLVQHGDLAEARQAAEQLLLLDFELFRVPQLPEQDWEAAALTLAASLCNSTEATRCIGLADRAKTMLTSPAAAGRLTVDGKENLAAIARLQAEAAASLAPDTLERTGRLLDAAAANNPNASEQFTRAGEATWNLRLGNSAISSQEAREAELAAREGYRTLVARFPESDAYRFLFAETHRMECYTHFAWDGQVEAARAAFRRYDALLEPFVGRKGYSSVLRTRMFNSLHLAQLAASVGDETDAGSRLQEAQERFEAYRDSLPEGVQDRGLALARFLEESAWSAWWLRDWPGLARLARDAHAECEARLKEQPANEELINRMAIADGFAALASAGPGGPSAEAATQLHAARDRLKTTRYTESVYGCCDGDAVVWALENAWCEALRKSGGLEQAKRWAGDLLCAYEDWVPDFPEYWPAQKHLAVVRVQAAGTLDPADPYEGAHRKQLLDQAAATFAPEKVNGRLTADVQGTLKDIERLSVATALPRR